jgi:hypothetical protein
MKTFKLLFTLAVLVVAGFVTVPQRSHAQLDLYFMQMSKINGSTGELIYTGDMAGATEKQLKGYARSENLDGTVALIGNGAATPNDPITDIQIVGVGGKSYGDIQFCPPLEE